MHKSSNVHKGSRFRVSLLEKPHTNNFMRSFMNYALPEFLDNIKQFISDFEYSIEAEIIVIGK